MIDIHSHILFAVDDGARNLEESMEHIQKAIDLGYTGIVCSTHYKIHKFENENYNKNFKILENEVLKRKLPITLYKGNELDLRGDIIKVLENVNTINSSRYILVEFTLSLVYDAYIKIIDSLLDRGYIPVLAHVERYPYIKFNEFAKLYDKKVVFQMNLSTVSNMSKKVRFLLKNGYINVVASDAHKVGDRDYEVSEYLQKLKKIVGEKRFIELTKENPRKIIMNEDINFETRGENRKNEKILSFNGILYFIFKKLSNGIKCGRCDSKGENIK
jgi:protein-tyrosine phosphatase